ncbi:DUF4286 family protein [Larkinella terrae]|uniref:DUF4286 family protein n=2 Tax=Larkinella terrae TaxID=2025311 RepID=A0A7K0EKI5_9BACT|nr:DUF4286 family protein [Larkinella terrae]
MDNRQWSIVCLQLLLFMVLYNLTINIDKATEREWLNWMRFELVPQFMETGLPLAVKILRLLTEVENGGETYTFQFSFKGRIDYFRFNKLHADELLGKLQQQYSNQYVLFQSLLEEV